MYTNITSNYMTSSSSVISLRTSPGIIDELELLSQLESRSKADEIRLVMETGLRERRRIVALEKYRNREVTLSRAAEMAGTTIWEMAEAVQEANIAYHLDVAAVIKSAFEV